MKRNERLLTDINEKIDKCSSEFALKILNNCKGHISKIVEYKEISDYQYDALIDYFDTIYDLLADKDYNWNDGEYYWECNCYLRKLFEYFEGSKVLQKMFKKKHKIWEEEEFRDKFEDELYDEENPKWYSLDFEDYIIDDEITIDEPGHRYEASHYLLVDENNKTIRAFYCFDVAMYYAFKRDYDKFNKDYIKWVLNNPET